MPPPSRTKNNVSEFQFCICKIGESIETVKRPKIGSPSYSKGGFSQSVSKIGSLVKSNSRSKIQVAHFFSVDTELLLVQWINSISHVCAVHIADGVEENVNESPSREIKNEPEENLNVEIKQEEPEEDEEEINMREALRAQREKEKKEKQAATLIQSFWKMNVQRREYIHLLHSHRSAKLIQASYKRYKTQKTFKTMLKQHRYRVNVQKEMLSTEKSYLDGLNTLINIFLTPLRAQELINPSQIISVFSNIESVASLHQYLLTEISVKLGGGFIHPYCTIGNIFIFLVSLLYNY